METYKQWMLAVMVGTLAVVSVDSEAWAMEGGQGTFAQVEPTAEAETTQAAQAAPSVAGTSIGVVLGYDLDMPKDFDSTGAFLAGADLRFGFDLPDVAPGFGIAINPAVGHYFVSDMTLLQIDANVLAQFAVDPAVTIYGGLGPAIHFFRMSFGDQSESETEVNFNLFVGGASFAIDDAIDAFVQARLTRFSVSDEFGSFSTTFLSLMGGVHFGL